MAPYARTGVQGMTIDTVVIGGPLTREQAVYLASGTPVFHCLVLDKDTGRPAIACVNGRLWWEREDEWVLPVVQGGALCHIWWYAAECWSTDERYALARIADRALAA